MSGLKKYRVHFTIDVYSYRDVMAFDEQDAEEQVQGDFCCVDDFERSEPSGICVDMVELAPKPKKVRKRKQSK